MGTAAVNGVERYVLGRFARALGTYVVVLGWLAAVVIGTRWLARADAPTLAALRVALSRFFGLLELAVGIAAPLAMLLMMVVSLIGEQWSPRTEPLSTLATLASRIVFAAPAARPASAGRA